MSVMVSSELVVSEKIKKIKEGGVESLHIIADFDRTMTPGSHEGKQTTSTWNSFLPFLPPEYKTEHDEQWEKYHPIEWDPALKLEYKKEKMNEWWIAHMDLLVRMNLSEEIMQKAIESDNLYARKGLKELMKYAAKNNIPFLVFSAGVGNLIEGFLKKENLLTPNVHVIANFFNIKDGKVIGYQDEIVHSYNKSEVQLDTKPFKKEIDARNNCILLGDSIGDAKMADGLKHDTVLKFGFLNGTMKNLEAYLKVFDVVIVEDTEMTEVLKVLP